MGHSITYRYIPNVISCPRKLVPRQKQISCLQNFTWEHGLDCYLQEYFKTTNYVKSDIKKSLAMIPAL